MTIPFRGPSRAGVRPSPVFVALLVVAAVGGYVCWQATTDSHGTRLGVFLLVLAGWIVTVCLHEFAHAFLAWRFGDQEVEARGYLSLNPLKYSHPVLSILLPVLFIAIGGIGLPGGAVYLHPHRYGSKLRQALVSLAGPIINVIFAVILLATADYAWDHDSRHAVFWAAIAFLGELQVMAAILNLLPVPGLDGYGAIEPYLDPEFRRGAEQFKVYGMLAIFLLLQVDSINRAFFDAVGWFYDLSGAPRQLADVGYQLIKFWQSN